MDFMRLKEILGIFRGIKGFRRIMKVIFFVTKVTVGLERENVKSEQSSPWVNLSGVVEQETASTLGPL